MTTTFGRYLPGDDVQFEVQIVDLNGDPVTSMPGLRMTLIDATGATYLADASPVNDGGGAYHSDQTIGAGVTAYGAWYAVWSSAGSIGQNVVKIRAFFVDRPVYAASL